MMQRPKVLIVDDDAAVRDALVQTLQLADHAPIAAGSFVVARDHVTRDFAGVILSDIRMPGAGRVSPSGPCPGGRRRIAGHPAHRGRRYSHGGFRDGKGGL